MSARSTIPKWYAVLSDDSDSILNAFLAGRPDSGLVRGFVYAEDRAEARRRWGKTDESPRNHARFVYPRFVVPLRDLLSVLGSHRPNALEARLVDLWVRRYGGSDVPRLRPDPLEVLASSEVTPC